MKRLFVLMVVIMAISAPVFAANLLVNGDFGTNDETGWTRWNSPWGSGFSWDATSGSGILQVGSGSFGWWQAITTVPGQSYTINATFQGNGVVNWVECLFFNDDNRDIYQQLDSPLNSSLIAKVDGWGMNGGMPFGPCSITTKYFASGPKTNVIVATGTKMYVGLKTGANGTGSSTAAMFDDVSVTGAVPEPASLVALFAGLGGLIIRRKH